MVFPAARSARRVFMSSNSRPRQLEADIVAAISEILPAGVEADAVVEHDAVGVVVRAPGRPSSAAWFSAELRELLYGRVELLTGRAVTGFVFDHAPGEPLAVCVFLLEDEDRAVSAQAELEAILAEMASRLRDGGPAQN